MELTVSAMVLWMAAGLMILRLTPRQAALARVSLVAVGIPLLGLATLSLGPLTGLAGLALGTLVLTLHRLPYVGRLARSSE